MSKPIFWLKSEISISKWYLLNVYPACKPYLCIFLVKKFWMFVKQYIPCIYCILWRIKWFNSFGAKFQMTFVICFFFNKLSIGKKFICKVERLNVKQRRSRWNGSLWTASSRSMLFAKVIIIKCSSERVNYINVLRNKRYHIHPKYWDTISTNHTVFTLSIQTPQLLTIYVLKFEPVQFTTRCCV